VGILYAFLDGIGARGKNRIGVTERAEVVLASGEEQT
jgi:hypothetical protein